MQCFDISKVSTSNPNPNGVAVADQYCVQTRPVSTKACNTAACPDYRYRTGVWSSCSANCNGGTMTRNVTCHNLQGLLMSECTLTNCPVVDDSYCVAKGLTQPPSTSPCNQQSCYYSMWWSGDWGDCSKTCGTGTHTRSVDCVSTGTYTKVADSECGGSKPVTAQYCNTQKCAEYQWVPGSWTTCSAACDSGNRTRSKQREDKDEARGSTFCTPADLLAACCLLRCLC